MDSSVELVLPLSGARMSHCADDASRQTDDFRAAMINMASDGILACVPIDHDPFLHFWQWNARMEAITGYTRDEINRLGWLRTVFSGAGSKECVLTQMREVLAGKHLSGQECLLTHKNGSQRLTTISTSSAPHADGSLAIVALVQDITDRRRWEETLRESQRQHQLLLDAIPDIMIRARRDGTYLQYKPPRDFVPWLPFQPAELVGRNVRDAMPHDVAARTIDAIQAAIDTHSTQQFQYSIPVAGRLCHRDARVVRAGDDEALIIIRDITKRRGAEQERDALHRLTEAIGRTQSRFISKAVVSEVFSTMLDEALALTDSEFGFISKVRVHHDGRRVLNTLSMSDIAWDEATAELYARMSHEDFEFTNMNTLFGAVLLDDRPLIANDPANHPRRGGLPTGHPPLTSFLGVPLRHEGKTIGVMGLANRPMGYTPEFVEKLAPFWASCGTLVAAYLHEREHREAEQRLAQQHNLLAHATRLTTVGEMAAGLAHEITQPLGAISNFAAAAATILENDAEIDYERLLHWNRKIIEQASRAGQIVDRLRRFAQRNDPVREPHLLSDIVAEAIAFCAPHARRRRVNVQLASDADTALPVVVDRVQIQQVVVNLLTNAIEAADAGDMEDRQVIVRIDADADEATISVDDTGPGLPQAKGEQVFEPFFTTKPTGMGLGLTICRTIVQAHGGSIGSANLHPHGASFFFTLPRQS